MRFFFATIVVLAALTMHSASDGSMQTAISFEIKEGNPLAILLFVAIGLLVTVIARDLWNAGKVGTAVTLFPVLMALPCIAFTSPTSVFHLRVFIFTA